MPDDVGSKERRAAFAEAVRPYLDRLTGQLSADDLGMLVWCALDYDRRLPHGQVPPRVWALLSQEWKDKINRWAHTSLDAIGAEVRQPGG